MIKLEHTQNCVTSTVVIDEELYCGDVVEKMAAFLVLAGYHNDSVADALLEVSNSMTPDEEDKAISHLVDEAQELDMGYESTTGTLPAKGPNYGFIHSEEDILRRRRAGVAIVELDEED